MEAATATAKNIAHFTTFILTEGARPAGPPSSKTEHWRRTASCLEDPFTIASEEGENDAIARAVGKLLKASSIKNHSVHGTGCHGSRAPELVQ